MVRRVNLGSNDRYHINVHVIGNSWNKCTRFVYLEYGKFYPGRKCNIRCVVRIQWKKYNCEVRQGRGREGWSRMSEFGLVYRLHFLLRRSLIGSVLLLQAWSCQTFMCLYLFCTYFHICVLCVWIVFIYLSVKYQQDLFVCILQTQLLCKPWKRKRFHHCLQISY